MEDTAIADLLRSLQDPRSRQTLRTLKRVAHHPGLQQVPPPRKSRWLRFFETLAYLIVAIGLAALIADIVLLIIYRRIVFK